jgi:hypothetical protein
MSVPSPYEGGVRGGSVRISALFFSVLVFLFSANAAFAVSVSPPVVEMTLDRESNKIGAISIINTEDHQVSYDVSFQNFIAKGEEGQQEFVESNLVFRDLDWILPQNDKITIEAGQRIDFGYKVRVPKDASPGGHYLVMFLSKKTNPDVDGTGASVNSKIGVLFFIRVNGAVVEKLDVESFRLMQTKDELNRLPVLFESRFINSGNVHVRPAGDIVIKNALGNISAVIPLNPKGSMVLTNSIRRVESQWKKNINAESGQKGSWFKEIKNEWQNFAFGPYTADIKGFYGEEKNLLSGRISFWIFPRHLIITGVVSLFILFVLFRVYRHELIRNMLKRAKKRNQ